MKNKMKNKIIKRGLIIAALTIGFGLTSCEKECFNDFKKEMSKECKKERSNGDSNPSDTLSNTSAVNN
jgi:hypothetical protein